MSGWRTCGSSTGQRLVDDLARRAGEPEDGLGELEQRHLVGVADVHRAGARATRRAGRCRGSGRRRSRSCASASRRRRPSAACPSSAWRTKVGIARPSFGAHPRAVGVEDADDRRVHALLAVVRHRQRLGVALRLVVDAARADRVDVAPVGLRLRVHLAGRRRPRSSRRAGSARASTSRGRARGASRTSRSSASAAAGAGSRSGSRARRGGRRSRPARRMSMGSVTSWLTNVNASSRRCSMFSSVETTRLSTQMTRWPRCEERLAEVGAEEAGAAGDE